VLLSSICGIVMVDGRSSGAPMEACGTTTDIVPNHMHFASSTHPLPFAVDLSGFKGKKYYAGQTYNSECTHREYKVL